MSSPETTKSIKKMPRGSIRLQFAGDIILARCDDSQLSGLFKRYEALFESFANMEKQERILGYKLFNALMLTSYAKKVADSAEKHQLFDRKNQIFINLANDKNMRKFLAMKYLVSKNFRVTDYCESCVQKNQESQSKKHEWKHCKGCKLDRDFYNVVAMSYKFACGYVRIFLSNDLLHKISFQKVKGQTSKLAEVKEEAVIDKYRYNARNLDAIAYESVIGMYERFINK